MPLHAVPDLKPKQAQDTRSAEDRIIDELATQPVAALREQGAAARELLTEARREHGADSLQAGQADLVVQRFTIAIHKAWRREEQHDVGHG